MKAREEKNDWDLFTKKKVKTQHILQMFYKEAFRGMVRHYAP